MAANSKVRLGVQYVCNINLCPITMHRTVFHCAINTTARRGPAPAVVAFQRSGNCFARIAINRKMMIRHTLLFIAAAACNFLLFHPVKVV